MKNKKPKRKNKRLTNSQMENLRSCIEALELPSEAYELLSSIPSQEISAYLHSKIKNWLNKYEAVYGKQE